MIDPFWSKVSKRDEDECWSWLGAHNAKGYGNYRSKSAHVVAYELEYGAIPAGLTIDHLCSNRECVNPAHLEAVTLRENIRRHAAKTTRCKRGHPLSGDNVELDRRPDGTRRRCLACRKIYNDSRQRRRK